MSNDVEDKARRGNAFKIAACDYLAQRIQPQGARAPLSETTMTKAERMLESFVYPHIADLSLHLYPRWQHQRGQPGDEVQRVEHERMANIYMCRTSIAQPACCA